MSSTISNETNWLFEMPLEYLVMYSPNDGESGTYACPFEGCDGAVFVTIQECYEHHREWHSSPYSCPECGANFSAYTALSRHKKASGHQRWVCRDNDCDSKGVEFDIHMSYYAHVIASSAHLHFSDDMYLESGDGERSSDVYMESDVDMDSDTSEELSEGPSLDEFTCREPCCPGYMKQLATERALQAHTNTKGHTNAVKGGEGLLQQDLPDSELQAKQEAMRDFRCDVKGCRSFQRRLSSSTAYFNHIETTGHRFPEEDIDAIEIEDDSDAELSCDVFGCPQYGRQFSTHYSYRQHVQSKLHRSAARNSPETPSRMIKSWKLRRVKEEPSTDEVGIDERALDFWSAPRPAVTSTPTTSLFETPKRSTFSATTPTDATTPYTPISLPFATARQEYLERRNRELEDELRRVHAQLDLLKRRARTVREETEGHGDAW